MQSTRGPGRFAGYLSALAALLLAPAALGQGGVAQAASAESQELGVQLSGSLRLVAPFTTSLPVDDLGTTVSPSPLGTRVRVGPEVRYGGLGLIAELDTASGAIRGLPGEGFADRTPYPAMSPLELRQLYGEYKGKTWVARAGQQAANWGLGLLANSGAKDPAPGEAFGDLRFGDLVYRLALAGRPLFGLGGAWRALEPIAAVDMVVRDDTADFWAGDRALQGVLALRFAVDADHQLGVYAVSRRQRPAVPLNGGGETDALVFDLAGRWQWKGDSSLINAGFEVASIQGSTTQARSDTASRHQLRQLGAAAKVSAQWLSLTGFLDFGYASGDHNPFDDKIEAFRFDPDYNVGLLLFEEVLGWQTARTGARASDLTLVGVPPEGVQLLPTRGAVTGAWYLFPRVRYGATGWLDLYGGPLFAFSTAKLVDPFNTRVAGGEVLNALGGRPGSYLGTELDLGFQVRVKPHRAVDLALTAEGGYLIPGGAFEDARGQNMAKVATGRLRFSINL